MDIDELHKKLKEEKTGPVSAMETQAEKKKKLVYSSVTVGIFIIVVLGVWSMMTAPSKEEAVLPPQVCFKGERCFDIIFALTAQEQETGYSNYSVYPDGKAMVFVIEPPREQAMWMKDMDFSIDMVWVDSRDKIFKIVKSAPPCRSPPCEIFESSLAASYIIEVPSGFALDANLFDGDEVRFKNWKR